MIHQAKDLPQKIEDLAKEIHKKSPGYDEAQVWATAWSIYCKYVNPGSSHCSKGPDGYFKTKSGSYRRADMQAAGQKTAGQVAKTIAEQMGGVGRLKAMLGAQVTALSGDKGLAIKWPNKQRSKGNYVEIIYNRGQDLYDMTFYNLTIRDKKKVKEYRGVYADQLGELFEKQTGWYLRLASRVATRYLGKMERPHR